MEKSLPGIVEQRWQRKPIPRPTGHGMSAGQEWVRRLLHGTIEGLPALFHVVGQDVTVTRIDERIG
jgi:hypothetical protein